MADDVPEVQRMLQVSVDFSDAVEGDAAAAVSDPGGGSGLAMAVPAVHGFALGDYAVARASSITG
jgi:hypothetical protein